ncbi:MAG: hypothetical protein LBQ65_04980 [Tannerellaceae bacterium]|jgi:hypothetical protein|nr:hypothetical protein [Tannerellaceae bacterium]
MEERTFKYQKEINLLIEMGAILPLLFEPVNKEAYRYIFSGEHPNNHIPVYRQKPQRVISDIDKNRLNTSGYALSCYNYENNAVLQYESLRNTHPLIYKTIGDALCYGILDSNDGRITSRNGKGHFDLYEFYECDLSSKFKIVRSLV